MSTIGYGDISAITTSERTVASVVMVLGCGFFAWATGRLTHILTKTHICTDKFNSKLEVSPTFSRSRAIGPVVAVRPWRSSTPPSMLSFLHSPHAYPPSILTSHHGLGRSHLSVSPSWQPRCRFRLAVSPSDDPSLLCGGWLRDI
eukprot:3933612-Rhodomonas_salina.3